jgi:hypothetical protein
MAGEANLLPILPNIMIEFNVKRATSELKGSIVESTILVCNVFHVPQEL